MFEDDAGFQVYHELCRDIFLRRQLPEKTQVQSQKNEGIAPVIVRLLQRNGTRLGLRDLIFYDPAGELIQNLNDVVYLRYLARSHAIIYLLQAPHGPRQDADQQASEAGQGLSAVIHQVRRENNHSLGQRLPQVLAVALTKCDQELFAVQGPEAWVAGFSQGQRFWSRPGWFRQRESRQISRRCEQLLQERGFSEVVNMARHNFVQVAFFAVSSLGRPLAGEHILEDPQPIGVEQPLFWALEQLA